MRTRLWMSEMSSTAVQFRTDLEPKVWLHTNIGWVPVGNAPTEEADAEAFAEDVAKGYGLAEQDERTARYFAGEED